jgi:hypothetical protein
VIFGVLSILELGCFNIGHMFFKVPKEFSITILSKFIALSFFLKISYYVYF